ncbi:MAG: hypothetical protein ACXWCN_08690 [Caldimonas sp.]
MTVSTTDRRPGHAPALDESRYRKLSTDPNDMLAGLGVFIADQPSRITYGITGPPTPLDRMVIGSGTTKSVPD